MTALLEMRKYWKEIYIDYGVSEQRGDPTGGRGGGGLSPSTIPLINGADYFTQ